MGRAFRDGRHRPAGRQGLVGLIEGQGGACPLRCRRCARSSSRMAPRPASGSRRARRSRADIVVSNADSAWTYRHLLAPAAAPPLDRPADRARALLDEPVRLVFRHQTPVPRRRRTTRSCSGPRYQRAAAPTSSSARCWPTISASICTARPRPTRRWRRRAATRSTCSSPVPHLGSGTDWRAEAERYRRSDRALSGARPCCPAWRTRSSPRAC